MRICLVNPYYQNVAVSVIEVTGRYRHVESLAAALARRKHDVVVVQAFHKHAVEHRNGAEFRYARVPYRSVSRLSGGPLGVDLLMTGNLKAVLDAIKDARPDAVHMNGLTLIQPLSAIGAWCAKTGRPFTVTFHGGRPRTKPWLLPVQRRILERCRGVFFTTRRHAEPWVNAGLLKEDQVIPCMEVSSNFSPQDRTEARARTGMKGNPVFAWNARLHPIKDPLTALKGFSLIRRSLPEARLHMIYYSTEMETEVREAIASDPRLRDAVEMRGTIPPKAVEDFFNSSDFLIQTSLQEVAGYSVLEAMSCGVIPIITDIPSFRAMTDGGRVGVLFPVGDHNQLAARTLAIDLADIGTLSRQVRAFFDQALSYDAIARTYEATLNLRQSSEYSAAIASSRASTPGRSG
jgi:glycosyltransferase involved in cell wall biosynthesis